MSTHPLTPRVRQLVGGFTLMAGIAVLALGALNFARGSALLSRGVRTEASLTRTDHQTEDSDTGHQLYYRFEVGGREYTRVGVFGTPVRSDVSQKAQAEAVRTGKLEIRYLPEEPSVNEPVEIARPQREKGVLALGFGVAIALLGAFRLYGARARAARP